MPAVTEDHADDEAEQKRHESRSHARTHTPTRMYKVFLLPNLLAATRHRLSSRILLPLLLLTCVSLSSKSLKTVCVSLSLSLFSMLLCLHLLCLDNCKEESRETRNESHATGAARNE